MNGRGKSARTLLRPLLFAPMLVVCGCTTRAVARETPIIRPPPAIVLPDPPAPTPVYTGLAANAAAVLSAVEEGTHASLRAALTAIRADGLF
jgi:hypothetical protein